MITTRKPEPVAQPLADHIAALEAKVDFATFGVEQLLRTLHGLTIPGVPYNIDTRLVIQWLTDIHKQLAA